MLTCYPDGCESNLSLSLRDFAPSTKDASEPSNATDIQPINTIQPDIISVNTPDPDDG